MKQLGFDINLQLFSEDKTEKATPRRRKKAREKGQVIKSRELSSSVILIIILLILKYALPNKIVGYTHFMKPFLTDYIIDMNLYNLSNLATLNRNLYIMLFNFLLPILGGAVVVSILINFIQVGALFTTEPIRITPNRLNPVEGLKRIFSKRAVVELLKGILKISLVIYIVYLNFKSKAKFIPLLMDMEIVDGMRFIGGLVFDVSIKVGIALLILSIGDYLYQWWEYERNLMMSKEDIKEELKQTEGNPLIKSRIKQIQRQMTMRRMIQEIPEADVVITNPYHLAVAVKYDSEKHLAPIVVAKGANIIAEKIKEVAKINDVEVVENKPLAQLLYKNVEIGDVIPEELYQTVAEILAFVYNLKQRRA